jgi:hypothetical protein
VTGLREAFLAAVAAWNIYILPVILAVVVGVVARRGGGRAGVVRRVGLAHLGLALGSALRVAEELWAYRLMGIFPENPVTGLPGSVLALLCDVPVGLGLLALRPWARGAGLALAAFRTALAGYVLAWSWGYGASFDWTEWPRLAVARALPPFALLVLLRPVRGRDGAGPGPASAWVAAVALGFLVVLGSAVVTDAVDFALRVIAELAAGPGP